MGAEELVTALRRAMLGETPISPTLATWVVQEIRHLGSFHGSHSESEAHQRLTPREAQVLALIGQGLTYKEVAAWLLAAEGTIKSHMRRILDKLGLKNRTEAVRYAHRTRLTDSPWFPPAQEPADALQTLPQVRLAVGEGDANETSAVRAERLSGRNSHPLLL